LFLSRYAGNNNIFSTTPCWIGILVKFWDLHQHTSKNKRKFEDGPEHVIGAYFKESMYMIGGSTMEWPAKGEK
jgi:hypothetical protein